MGNLERFKWAGLGMLVLLAVVPSGMAIAGTSPVTAISNLAGTRTVTLTTANQLLASESDPKQSVVIQGNSSGIGNTVMYTVPTAKALVLKSVTVGVEFESGDTSADVGLATGATTTDLTSFSAALFSQSQGVQQSQSLDLGSQVVIPTGHVVVIFENGASDGAFAYLYGYLIPAGAAPSTFTVHGSAPKINMP